MRFILAIAAFVVAAVMIGAGIAQRTIWEPPDHVTAQTTLTGDAPYAVISGSVLNANPNQQSLTISGASKVFAAYGRTDDVLAWVRSGKYASLRYDSKTNALTAKTVVPKKSEPAPSPAPTDGSDGQQATGTGDAGTDPRGSDLWLQEYSGTDSLFLRVSLPKDVSLIVASDGTDPAPKKISITWPVDSSVPWSGPLIVGGGILLLIGLCLYVWALLALRRSRGPRRKGIKPPRPPRPRYRPSRQKAIISSSKGRRSARRKFAVLVPGVLVSTLLLSGCSSDYWPTFDGASPSPTPSVSLLKAAPVQDAAPPAVTVPQLKQIMTDISAVAKKADSSRDADLAATRFTGPALAMRQANYTIRAKKKDEPAPVAIPSSPITLVLPQATKQWPRIVEAVVQDKDNPKTAPQFLILRQESPRANYHVAYAIELEPEVRVPDLAPAAVGASLVQPDTKLLKVAPKDLVSEYSDILAKGKDSAFYQHFDAGSDQLRDQIGKAYREKKKKKLPNTASISFSDAPGPGVPTSMATNDSGALVAVTLNETETVKPVEKGAEVSPEGAVKALSGIESTTKGVTSTYLHELLFYVPPANTQLQVRLLGFTLGLTQSSELK